MSTSIEKMPDFDEVRDGWRKDLQRERQRKIDDLLIRFTPLHLAATNTQPKEPETLDDYYSMPHLLWLLKRLRDEPLASPQEFYTRYGFLLGVCSHKFKDA